MVDETSAAEVEAWLQRHRQGDATASNQLVDLTYERLQVLTRPLVQRLSALKRSQEVNEVLHDAVVRLMNALQAVQPGSVREFYGLATLQIRRVLLDMAREAPPVLLGQDGQGDDLQGSDSDDPRRALRSGASSIAASTSCRPTSVSWPT